MAVYLGKEEIGVTIVVDDVTTQNINTYKYQDLSRVISTGGDLATDKEYESAENYLQGLYTLIMGG